MILSSIVAPDSDRAISSHWRAQRGTPDWNRELRRGEGFNVQLPAPTWMLDVGRWTLGVHSLSSPYLTSITVPWMNRGGFSRMLMSSTYALFVPELTIPNLLYDVVFV